MSVADHVSFNAEMHGEGEPCGSDEDKSNHRRIPGGDESEPYGKLDQREMKKIHLIGDVVAVAEPLEVDREQRQRHHHSGYGKRLHYDLHCIRSVWQEDLKDDSRGQYGPYVAYEEIL